MSLFKSAATIGFFTLLSRILGFVRDIIVARYLGAGVMADAFFAAFKLPNFFRSIFAEGAFNSAFVPIFACTLEKNNGEKAEVFARNILSLLLYTLLVVVLAMEIFMPWVMMAVAPGFISDPEKFSLSVSLARITFPYLLFISLVSLVSGILNSFEKFAAVSASPIILNITLIAALLICSTFNFNMAYVASYGVFISGVLQLLWILFFLFREGVVLYPKVPNITPKTKEFFRKFVPGVIGASVVHINSMIDVIIGSLIPGAVSYLYYADRISQLPLALIGTAMGVALLPSLSKEIKAGRVEGAMRTQRRALEIVLLLTLPASIALFIMAAPITSTLFARGEFGMPEVSAVSKVLMAYTFGLPAFVMVKVFAPSFFARGNTKTPMKIAVVCLMVNVVLNLAFFKPFGYVGIAFASVIASWANVLMLVMILVKKGEFKFSAKADLRIIKILISSVVMGGAVYMARILLFKDHDFNHGLWWHNFASLFVMVLAGIGTHFLMIYLLRVYEFRLSIRRKRRKEL